ncbi:hypothetical protein CF319_g1667 [Tilletia indica]|nr:hypothetical protein CF319_g1667 [Tilletia indica]
MAATDSRFDTSQWQTDSQTASTSALPLQSNQQGDSDEQDDQDDEQEEDFEDDDEDDDEDDEEEEKIVQPLSKAELEAYQRKQRKAGIIYISSIPHGMTPPKVRHLLSGFGDIERIYLHDGTQGKFGSAPPSRKRSSSAHYTEGWVEFAKKRIAKQVAEVLNAKPIGTALIAAGVKMPRGSGGGGSSSKNAGGARRWKDYVWTMKYLSGFKWSMLTEQMAAERASRTARLRTELAQSALEQKDYLQKVERARIMQDKETRRQRRQAPAPPTTNSEGGGDDAEGRDGSRVRTFKQRAPVLMDVRDQDKGSSGAKRGREADEGGKEKKKRKQEGGRDALDSVLGSIF